MSRPLESVRVDPLAPGDTATVQAVFDVLSEEQRAQRFHVPMPRLSSYMLRHLADVDGTSRVALVLSVAQRPAGIARYATTAPAVAELAIAVGAEYANRGYGRRLLNELLMHAAVSGVTSMEFEFMSGNAVVRHLAVTQGAVTRRTGLTVTGTLPIPPVAAYLRDHQPMIG